jgi:hypothetical protein
MGQLVTNESGIANFERFRDEFRDLLTHLHDPDYVPSPLLRTVLHSQPSSGAGPLQSEVLRAIADLKPSPGMPPTARARRDYELLHNRFVLQLTQEEAAEQLHMSVRNLRREQRTATHTLARILWERSLAARAVSPREARDGSRVPNGGLLASGEALDWRLQVRQDLASLVACAPGSVADVQDTINAAVELESILTARHGTSLEVGNVEPNLIAAIHPSALRQILIMAIAQLAPCISPGRITLHAEHQEADISITLTGPASGAHSLPSPDLIREILTSCGGSVEAGVGGDLISLRLVIPSAGQVTVLVVDDNLDSVHYYRRCTAGTRYHIVHADLGRRAMETLAHQFQYLPAAHVRQHDIEQHQIGQPVS